ncbi:MAG: NosD domain-containing protein [Thermoplasmatota archaeon]
MRDTKGMSLSLTAILLLASLAGTMIIFNAPTTKVSAVEITTPTDITTNTNYNEDVIIKDGGILRIHPGVIIRMGVGNKIFVEDGELSIWGNITHKTWVQTSASGYWGGIQTNIDSKLTLDKVELRFAEVGINCMGTGNALSSGSISITNTSFSTCTSGIILSGNGQPSPFKCIIRDNSIMNSDVAIELTTNYDGVKIENNQIYGAFDYGMAINGVERARILNNTFDECRFGFYMMGFFNYPSYIDNNTLRDCRIGLFGGFVAKIRITNNSILASEKGIVMGLTNENLIENNIITVISDVIHFPIEIESGSPATIIRNNILSACDPVMRVNGTASNHVIYNNLFTNLTDKMYIDALGDGFVDRDVLIPGSAVAKAKNCRTSVFQVGDGAGPESFVNPAQAANLAMPGAELLMISDPKGYGPKRLDDRHIYHTGLPQIFNPMTFIGEEREHLIFRPAACAADTLVDSTTGVQLSNFTIMTGAMGVSVIRSNDVTLKDISSYTYETPYLQGFRIDDCTDVKVEGVYLSNSFGYGINITDSDMVRIEDTRIVGARDIGIHMERSGGIEIQNTSVNIIDRYGLHAIRSSFLWNGSEIMSRNEGVVMDSCFASTLSNLTIWTPNTNDRGVLIIDSEGTRFENCEISMGYHNVDYKGIVMEGAVQRTTIYNCRFIGNQGNSKEMRALDVIGNFTHSRIEKCNFQTLTVGLIIQGTMTDLNTDIMVSGSSFYRTEVGVGMISFGNISVHDSFFGEVEAGVVTQAGDVEVGSSRFYDSQYGVFTSENAVVKDCIMNNLTAGIYVMGSHKDEPNIIASVQMENMEKGIVVEGAPILLSDSTISASEECLNLTDSDGSKVMESSLSGPVPVSLYLDLATENRIDLMNCSGNFQSSEVSVHGCFVNWSWPLRVLVKDEVNEPEQCTLTVTSDVFGTVFVETIEGSVLIPSLLGWVTDGSGGHDHKDYEVEGQDAGATDTANVEMNTYRTVELVLNHRPYISAEVPASITFEEDTQWSGDISGWFKDRDSLVFSIEDIQGSELHALLDGSELSVGADPNWTGEGNISLKATDTFDEEVSLTLDIEVTPVNDGPFLAMMLPVLEVKEDGSVWINLSVYGDDIDSLDLVWTDLSHSNCTLEWIGNNLTVVPTPDWFGVLEIPLVLSDGEIDLDTILTVNVTPVNDAPVWTGEDPLEITVTAGTPHSLKISDGISDVDNLFSELTITADSTHASMDGDSLIISYPDDTRNMTETITVTISDGELATDLTIQVTVIEKTPGPGPDELDIDEVRVEIDEQTGDWKVTVKGGEGQDIWIVIDGVGSFKLEETSPGNYEVTIPGENFVEGETYSYHFSDSEGGEDKTGGQHSGSMEQPVITPDDDDDNGEGPGSILWIILIVLLLIVIIAAVVIVSRRGSTYEDMEE